MLKLRDFGSSFATRERARELIRALPGEHTSSIELDGVLCSPSFLAEFLTRLTAAGPISVATTEPVMAAKLERMMIQLGLADKIELSCTVSA